MKNLPTAKTRRLRFVLALGATLALVCPELPPKYQAPCHAVAAVCQGMIP